MKNPDPITRRAMQEGRRHCQCCGRLIMANTGAIAHHGYQRPAGWYSQTASCMGARALPFEVSRDVLGQMIAAMQDHLERQQASRARIEADAQPLHFSYRMRRDYGLKIDRWVEVTRDTFEIVQEGYADELRKYGIHAFDTLKANALRTNAQGIQGTQDALTEQRARFDGWSQVERWDPDTGAWVAPV